MAGQLLAIFDHNDADGRYAGPARWCAALQGPARHRQELTLCRDHIISSSISMRVGSSEMSSLPQRTASAATLGPRQGGHPTPLPLAFASHLPAAGATLKRRRHATPPSYQSPAIECDARGVAYLLRNPMWCDGGNEMQCSSRADERGWLSYAEITAARPPWQPPWQHAVAAARLPQRGPGPGQGPLPLAQQLVTSPLLLLPACTYPCPHATRAHR